MYRIGHAGKRLISYGKLFHINYGFNLGNTCNNKITHRPLLCSICLDILKLVSQLISGALRQSQLLQDIH